MGVGGVGAGASCEHDYTRRRMGGAKAKANAVRAYARADDAFKFGSTGPPTRTL